MLPSVQKRITALVISLAIQVISLSGIAFASIDSVSNLTPLSSGIGAPVRVAFDNNSSAAGRAHNVYVSDARYNGVRKFSYYNKLADTIPTAGLPGGVQVGTAGDSAGKLIVGQGTYVSVINPSTKAEVFKLGSGVSQFLGVDGIALDDSGTIYVVDSKAAKIYSCTPGSGNSSTCTVGLTGSTSNNFTGAAFRKGSNQLAVADSLAYNVKLYTISGTTLTLAKTIGSMGTGNLQFIAPVGVAFATIGGVERMYVADAFRGDIQSINPTTTSGTWIANIGSYGVSTGQLMLPTDVVFDAGQSRLFAANGNANIVIYGINGSTNPTEPGAPSLTINALDASYGSTPIAISGTTSSNGVLGVAAVSCENTTTHVKYACTPSGTNWTCSGVALAIGANSFTCTAQYSGGSAITTATTSTNYNPVLDATIDSGVPSCVNQGLVLVSGTASTGATVCVSVDGGLCNAATQVDNSWQAYADLGSTESAHQVCAKASKAGYGDKTVCKTITLDITAPALAVSAIAGGGVTSGQLQNVTGTVSDARFDKVKVNNVEVAVTNGVFSYPVILANGANTIAVAATDLCGNTATDSRVVSLNFDQHLPMITVVSPADGSAVNTNSATIAGSVANASALEVNGVPVAITGGNWSTSVSLQSGMNTIEVVATNLNSLVSREKRTIFYNSANPALSLEVKETQLTDMSEVTSTKDFAANMPNVTVSGTIGSGNLSAISINGQAVTPLPEVSSGKFDLPVVFAAQGNYPVVVTVTNGSTTSSVIRTVVFDNLYPDIQIDGAHSTTTKLSGLVSAGGIANVLVKNGDTLVDCNVTINNNGTWSADLLGVPADPTTYKVTATDVAGNTAFASFICYAGNGDMNEDGRVDVADAQLCQKVLIKALPITINYLDAGDVGPIIDGVQHPNGVIDSTDCTLILRKAVGLPVPF